MNFCSRVSCSVDNADKKIVAYVKEHVKLAKKYGMKMYEEYTGRKWKAFTTCPLCGKKLESPVTNMEG